MAMAKPVIATAHGGSIETMVHGETGWLVEPANPEEMGRRISAALKDNRSLKQLGRNGMQRVQQHFTTESMCQNTVELYSELLSEKKRR